MTYVLNKRSSEEIYRDAVEDIKAFTDLEEVAESSSLSGILRAMANRSSDLYDSIEANFFAGYTRTASGPWLDALAEDWGLTRQVNDLTRVPCTSRSLYLRTVDGSTIYNALGLGGSYTFMPKGVSVTSTTDPSLLFTVDETTVVTPTDVSIPLGVSGIVLNGQKLPAGTLDVFDYASVSIFDGADLNNFELVQTKTITGVESVETDDSLRARINLALQSAATGNEASVLSVLAPYPEVADFFVDRNVRGTGSADIVVFPRFERVPSIILQRIEDSLLATAAFGTDIKVVEPDYVKVSVALQVTGSPSTTALVNAVEDIIKDTDRKEISHNILVSELSQRGFTVTVSRLSVDNRDLLSAATLNIFPTEMFELQPRNTSEEAITIV